jgi:hypothetical protein
MVDATGAAAAVIDHFGGDFRTARRCLPQRKPGMRNNELAKRPKIVRFLGQIEVGGFRKLAE